MPNDRDRGKNKGGSKRARQSGEDKTRIHYALQIHNYESPITAGSPRGVNPFSLAPWSLTPTGPGTFAYLKATTDLILALPSRLAVASRQIEGDIAF
jgi:hypothetical protein